MGGQGAAVTADGLAAGLARAADAAASGAEEPLAALVPLLEASAGLDSEARRAVAEALEEREGVYVSASRLLVQGAAAGGRDDPLCRWLYALYRDGSEAEHRLVLRFVPLLVECLLRSRSAVGAAAVLLSVYNRERANQGQAGGAADGLFDDFAVRLPDLSAPSVYHRPDAAAAAGSQITATALRELAEDLGEAKTAGARVQLPPVESLSEGGVLRLALVCLARYVSRLGRVGRASQVQFCGVCALLCGFPAADVAEAAAGVDGGVRWEATGAGAARVALSRPMAHVMVRGVSHCLEFAWSRPVAALAMRALHTRATEELWPDVLLSTTCAMERLELDF